MLDVQKHCEHKPQAGAKCIGTVVISGRRQCCCMKAGHHKCVLMHAGKYKQCCLNTQPNTQSLSAVMGASEPGAIFPAPGAIAAATTTSIYPPQSASGVLRVCDDTLTVPC